MDKKDIWKTKSDGFASAANYLKNTGWNYNQTWGRKVYIGKLSNKYIGAYIITDEML